MTAKPAYSYYGQPVLGSIRPAGMANGSKPASASAPYLGRQRCIANEDTCEGPQAKGTEYCIGHLRAAEKGKEV